MYDVNLLSRSMHSRAASASPSRKPPKIMILPPGPPDFGGIWIVVCMCVCVCACMYVCVCVFTHACMYVCSIYVCIYTHTHLYIHICMYGIMHACATKKPTCITCMHSQSHTYSLSTTHCDTQINAHTHKIDKNVTICIIINTFSYSRKSPADKIDSEMT